MAANYVPNENDEPVKFSRVYSLLQALAYPPWFDRTLNRLRGTVTIESGTVTTVSTVTTVTTVTGVTNIDSIQGRLLPLASQISAWTDCVRSRIT
jgi:ABC-type Fe2+-enterobactin transport system substrate-binding protein